MRVACLCVVVVVVVCSSGCPPPELICSPKDEAELARLAAYVDVQCDVDVTDTALSTLDGLQGLRTADSVTIGSNADLADVELGLSGLETVAFVSVFSNPRLGALVLDQDGVGGVSASGNDLAVVDVVLNDRAALHLQNEPLQTLRVRGQSLNSLVIGEATQLATLAEVDVDSVFALQIFGAPALPQAELDAFVARLDPPPSSVNVCGLADGPPC